MKIDKTAGNKDGNATRIVDAPLTLKQIGPVRRLRQPIDGDEFCFALKGIKGAEQPNAQYRYWVYLSTSEIVELVKALGVALQEQADEVKRVGRARQRRKGPA